MNEFSYAYLLTLSYDGSDFKGWIIQAQARTVQGELEKGIKHLIKQAPFRVIGASKTDTGVHALDQKVLLLVNFPLANQTSFQAGLNQILPLDLRITAIRAVEPNFAIRQTRQKTYCYTINDHDFDVFTQRYELNWKHGILDTECLTKLFALFVGEHDYFAFSGLSHQEQSLFQTKRTVDAIKVERDEQNKVRIYFQAKGFIRYQIRMIVAAVLQCYLNNPRCDEQIIQQRLTGSKEKSPFNVSGKGLCLISILYE